MNNEEKAIIFAYESGTITEKAIESARRNERGFKYNWTVEQHEEAYIAKAKELQAMEVTADAPKSNKSKGETFNTGFGYYGSARDSRRGFDGIE